jgi:hypothetical protein
MAFYIKIQKTTEDDAAVRYAFESDEGGHGLLELNKQTGEAVLIEPMPGDQQRHCFNRAAVKVAREWRDGRLPKELEWAS